MCNRLLDKLAAESLFGNWHPQILLLNVQFFFFFFFYFLFFFFFHVVISLNSPPPHTAAVVDRGVMSTKKGAVYQLIPHLSP